MSATSPQFQPSAAASPGTLTRSAFFALTPHDQARAIREGWRVVDDPVKERTVVISKHAFDRMPPAGQQMYMSRGGTVVD